MCSSIERYNLIPRRHIFWGLATYFELGDLFSGAKSLNSPCFVATWKARIRVVDSITNYIAQAINLECFENISSKYFSVWLSDNILLLLFVNTESNVYSKRIYEKKMTFILSIIHAHLCR